MSTPEPDDESGYPSQWRPAYIVERDEALEPLAIERHLAALDPRELALLLQRVKAMR